MRAGQRVGPFEVEKQLGGGAMGSVYQARYCKTGQKVALKVMAPGLGANETALARFEREAEVLKQLSHRNIVRFYVASRYEGAPYYAMEYIQGESLDQVLKRRGRLTWEEVVDLGRQICAALQHAHEQGIVHRDLKPSNLMLTADGTLKLTDFGIAKDLDVTQLTAANCTVGTASYMSPEQCRGERNLTHKSDLYSLGVLLYELLTGQRPFRAETTMDMFLQHVNVIPERPARIVLDIPFWLDTLVCQLLEKKPEHRPFDAAVVAAALDQVAEKVAAQQSAGVDVARARAVKRSISDGPGRDKDTKTARTLLTGLQRGRRKRRTKQPLFEKGWVQATAILGLLLAVAGVLYLVFQPSSADKLFTEAQHLMERPHDPERVAQARNGPIKDYLYYYADRKDSQTEQMRRWADQYDIPLREQQLENRHRLNLSPEGEAEAHARKAVKSEEVGDWDTASAQWTEVETFKGDADNDLRLWGLVAEKRLRDLAMAAAFESRWVQLKRPQYPVDPSIVLNELRIPVVSRAIVYELWGDLALARANWQILKERCEKDVNQRLGFLIAAKRLQELKISAPAVNKEEETKARLQLVKALLDEARMHAATQQPSESMQARGICTEITNLYNDSPDPSLRAIKEQAQQLRDQLARLEQKR